MITQNSVFEALGHDSRQGCIDIYSVAEHLGIHLMSWPLPGDTTSKITVKHGNVILAVNSRYETSESLFRFIAAHAFGHMALGHLRDQAELVDTMVNYRMPGKNAMEAEATRWGVDLLAPKDSVLPFIKNVQNPGVGLSNHLKIPTQLANYLVSNQHSFYEQERKQA